MNLQNIDSAIHLVIRWQLKIENKDSGLVEKPKREGWEE
jgi:hypothetical protein